MFVQFVIKNFRRAVVTKSIKKIKILFFTFLACLAPICKLDYQLASQRLQNVFDNALVENFAVFSSFLEAVFSV